jgi:fructuronate reductase
VLAGDFPAGRPRWDQAGARFVSDVEPYERRKLRLLNGAHSLLAYLGLNLGHRTVAAAVADEYCELWLRRWWAEASRDLELPPAQLQAYCDRLLERFANPRIEHELVQIAADGSQKLPVRVVPVLRLYRSRQEMPAAAIMIIAAWVRYLRAAGSLVADAGLTAGWTLDATASMSARTVLGWLSGPDGDLPEDGDLVAAVAAQL